LGEEPDLTTAGEGNVCWVKKGGVLWLWWKRIKGRTNGKKIKRRGQDREEKRPRASKGGEPTGGLKTFCTDKVLAMRFKGKPENTPTRF